MVRLSVRTGKSSWNNVYLVNAHSHRFLFSPGFSKTNQPTPPKKTLTHATDENYIHPHAHRGTLSLANAGPHSAFSQFVIALTAKPYFDKKYVCFGRLVDGEETLRKIEAVSCVMERPVIAVEVAGCGVWKADE